MESWNEKLNRLIIFAIAEAGTEDPIDFDLLVKSALWKASDETLNALAEKQVRREVGTKLRKWAIAVEQPMIPDLIGRFHTKRR